MIIWFVCIHPLKDGAYFVFKHQAGLIFYLFLLFETLHLVVGVGDAVSHRMCICCLCPENTVGTLLNRGRVAQSNNKSHMVCTFIFLGSGALHKLLKLFLVLI